HARALRERSDDLAGQREHRRLVGGTVPDGQGATVLGERVEDAAERGAQTLRLGGHELGIGTPKRLEVGPRRLGVGLAPPALGFGTEPPLDDRAAGHAFTEPGEEARQRLRRPLRTRRDEEVVTARQSGTDLERGAHAVRCQLVAVVVGMAPQLDGPGHAFWGVRPATHSMSAARAPDTALVDATASSSAMSSGASWTSSAATFSSR